MLTKTLTVNRQQRAQRVRAKLASRSDLPRVHVKRSNQHFHSQIIDRTGKVLASFSTVILKEFKGTKTEAAKEVGQKLSELAKKVNIKAVVLDRSHYRYHGRVKAFVDSLREGGIKI